MGGDLSFRAWHVEGGRLPAGRVSTAGLLVVASIRDQFIHRQLAFRLLSLFCVATCRLLGLVMAVLLQIGPVARKELPVWLEVFQVSVLATPLHQLSEVLDAICPAPLDEFVLLIELLARDRMLKVLGAAGQTRLPASAGIAGRPTLVPRDHHGGLICPLNTPRCCPPRLIRYLIRCRELHGGSVPRDHDLLIARVQVRALSGHR